MNLIEQKTFDIHLVAAKYRLNDLIGRFCALDGLHLFGLGGHWKSGDLNACQGREVADIRRMVGWQPEGAYLLGDPEAPVVLHGSTVVRVTLRMPAAVPLLVDD